MWPAALAWIRQRLAHFLVYFILGALLIWLIFGAMLKPVLWPNPTTTQTGTIANYNLQPKSYFGCTNWQIRPDPVKK